MPRGQVNDGQLDTGVHGFFKRRSAVTTDDPKLKSPPQEDELSLEVLDIVHGGRRAPYSKGELEDLARQIHVPEPAVPGLVIPPVPFKKKP